MNRTTLMILALAWSAWSMGDTLEDCDPTPTPVESPPPKAPNLKLAVPVEGYALLEFTVTEQGDVIEVELIQAYAPPAVPGLTASFALAAIAAVKTWKYEPVESRCRVSQKLSFSSQN